MTLTFGYHFVEDPLQLVGRDLAVLWHINMSSVSPAVQPITNLHEFTATAHPSRQLIEQTSEPIVHVVFVNLNLKQETNLGSLTDRK